MTRTAAIAGVIKCRGYKDKTPFFRKVNSTGIETLRILRHSWTQMEFLEDSHAGKTVRAFPAIHSGLPNQERDR
ncbi:hypothetical protein H3S80_04090 [Bartonella sp. M0177]|uniref:hypothetical protein n=1 Tax=Bartonella sp. M0177 TaxID=2750940 RepID=UPI0018DCA423|nr:hypothetical protein [Bartonella sp. M0177]MBI0003234.1 hypothetical protein [Bartonella sp. M0177]